MVGYGKVCGGRGMRADAARGTQLELFSTRAAPAPSASADRGCSQPTTSQNAAVGGAQGPNSGPKRHGPYSAKPLNVAALGPEYAAKFWSRVDKSAPGGCWYWNGGRQGQGYGRYLCGGFIALTHRIAYELAKGPVPPGRVLDHLCRVPRCCNPDHLEVVTQRVNHLRGNSIAVTKAKAAARRGARTA